MQVVVRGLTKVYTTSQGDVRAIGGVNLDVRDREFFGIIGPTGCGKTTLLHVIGRLEAPTTGTVEFVGEQHAKSPVSMVFQEAALMPWRTVVRTFGRHEAESCHRAGSGQRSRGGADGRAVRQPRRANPSRHARGAFTHLGTRPENRDSRHP